MKIGTIIKATFIAGAVTGAVGVTVLTTGAKQTTKLVQKIYTKVTERKKEDGKDG